MAQRKIYCVGGNTYTSNWMCGINTTKMEEADIVLFPGGADVEPTLYNEEPHPFTMWDVSIDTRDLNAFKQAKELGKRMVGICRGAQFLCAMAGGKLVQHQHNGSGDHVIYTYDGEIIRVSSDHHQAMYPWTMSREKYEVLGWALGQSKFHEGADRNEIVVGSVPLNMEVEIAFFPEIKALGIQSHPEWQYPKIHSSQDDKAAISYMRILLNIFMDGHDFKESENAYNIVAETGN
jgi:anthranilate/para-aminobenzoate synthase component II